MLHTYMVFSNLLFQDMDMFFNDVRDVDGAFIAKKVIFVSRICTCEQIKIKFGELALWLVMNTCIESRLSNCK